MPLDAEERAALQQAQAAVIQTKAEAKKGEDGATAINKPINKGLPKAKTAIQSTFASANAAGTAAVNAKALAKKHAAKLAESITAAKNAAERALKNKVAADLAYTTVERNLNQKSSALERAAEDAADTAKKAGQAVVPASMTDRMARLIHEEAEATNKRAASERALDAAKLEITKAQERFTTATTAADTTVRCNQGYLSKAWYGPTVTAEEVAARSALDKAQADLSVPDENFNRLEREMAIAVSQRTSYQEKIDEKKALKSGADSASKKAAAALNALQMEVTTLRGEATRLGSKLPDIDAINTAKSKELEDLKKLLTLDAEADSALLVVSAARLKGIAACDALELPEERLDADIDSGAVFTGLTSGQTLALTEFNKKDTFGKEARRLGPALDKLSDETAFLAAMAKETPVPTTKILGSGSAQQVMKKWEYPDGTVVRYKPDGDAYSGGLATYSVEVKVDKSKPDQSLSDIAFKVDPKGRAVPMGPGDVNNPFGSGTPKETYRDGSMKLGHRSLAAPPPVVPAPVVTPTPVVTPVPVVT